MCGGGGGVCFTPTILCVRRMGRDEDDEEEEVCVGVSSESDDDADSDGDGAVTVTCVSTFNLAARRVRLCSSPSSSSHTCVIDSRNHAYCFA